MQRLLGYGEGKQEENQADNIQDQAAVSMAQVQQVQQPQPPPPPQQVPTPDSILQMQVPVQQLQVQQPHTQQVLNQNFLPQMVPQFYSSEEVVENQLLKFGNTMHVN